ncbi:MAG: GNAT family N-acetyltransferase [Prevotellaceae bacterium]|nr:GNAT family N-acetyltransferase [Prevotellaceae bacterium]
MSSIFGHEDKIRIFVFMKQQSNAPKDMATSSACQLNCYDFNPQGIMAKNISISEHHRITDIRLQWEELDRMSEKNTGEGGNSLPYVCYSFYQTYQWNVFLYEYIRRSVRTRLTSKFCYILMMSDNRPFAILPMIITRSSGKARIPSCRIAGILNMACPYTVDGHEEELEKLAQYIKEHHADKHLSFADVPRKSPFAGIMESLGGNFTERGSYHVPLAQFETFDDYIGSLSKNIYKNIRKSYNHLTTDGKLMRLQVYTKDNLPEDSYMRQLWNIYFIRRLMWHHKNINTKNKIFAYMKAWAEVKGGCCTESLRRLENARLYVLEIDGQPAAFMVIYADKRHLLMPRLAIDTAYSRYSPGILIILESVKLWQKEGIADFDMCRGDERYKMDVGGINEPLCRSERKAHQ